MAATLLHGIICQRIVMLLVISIRTANLMPSGEARADMNCSVRILFLPIKNCDHCPFLVLLPFFVNVQKLLPVSVSK
jgi:hypothetical protein